MFEDETDRYVCSPYQYTVAQIHLKQRLKALEATFELTLWKQHRLTSITMINRIVEELHLLNSIDNEWYEDIRVQVMRHVSWCHEQLYSEHGAGMDKEQWAVFRAAMFARYPVLEIVVEEYRKRAGSVLCNTWDTWDEEREIRKSV